MRPLSAGFRVITNTLIGGASYFSDLKPAILYADNQKIATGQFDLAGRRDGHATFAKSSGDIPRNLSAAGIILKLKDGPRLTLKESSPCMDDSRYHVHFHFEVSE
jgi:hypothetical protein